MSKYLAPQRTIPTLRSPRALRDAMDYRRYTVRTLSVACGSIKHKSVIGNLRSGYRNTCDVTLARRIEEALGLYAGALFDLSTTNTNIVSTPRRRAA